MAKIAVPPGYKKIAPRSKDATWVRRVKKVAFLGGGGVCCKLFFLKKDSKYFDNVCLKTKWKRRGKKRVVADQSDGEMCI